MRILLSTVLASALLLSACNKVTKARNNLAGEWEVTSFELNGDEVIVGTTAMGFSFYECDAKEASDICSGQRTTSLVDGPTSFDYTLSADGLQLNILEDSLNDAMDYSLEWNGRNRIILKGVNKWGFDEELTLVKQ